MPRLRLDRRLALACPVRLSLTKGAALADPNGAILNAEKVVPEVPTIAPSGQADSKRATENTADIAVNAAMPMPSTKMTPDAEIKK